MKFDLWLSGGGFGVVDHSDSPLGAVQITGTSTGTASLSATCKISADIENIPPVLTVTGMISTGSLSANITGDATLTAHFQEADPTDVQLSAVIVGDGDLDGALRADGTMAAEITGSLTGYAWMRHTVTLAADIEGTAVLGVVADDVVQLRADISGGGNVMETGRFYTDQFMAAEITGTGSHTALMAGSVVTPGGANRVAVNVAGVFVKGPLKHFGVDGNWTTGVLKEWDGSVWR